MSDNGAPIGAIIDRMDFPCGCGDPDLVLRALRDALLNLDKRTNWAWAQNLGVQFDTAREVMLHLLDAFNLTEHGTSIYGSWLTPDGIVVLSFLQDTDCDSEKWSEAHTEWLNDEQQR